MTNARTLRQQQTPFEITLWSRLRDRRMGGYKFRRQHPLGNYVADFYCHECRLVIEIDGDTHAAQVEYDVQRTAWMNGEGLTVIRFTNRDVLHHLDSVLDEILAACLKLSGK